MKQGRGASVGDYGAPLFLAWQLTNRCGARCLHCCEESGPDKAWAGELCRDEALELARQAVELAVPYAAFGGGEPLGVPHVWEIFDILKRGQVALKIETNGLLIDDAAADRLRDLAVECVQISIDGATAESFETVRPEGAYALAVAAIKRLAERGLAPEVVFVPTRLNLGQAEAVFDLAAAAGARAFVTGPMMRLGRAASAWDRLCVRAQDWNACVARLQERAAFHGTQVALSVYPWDIQEEIRRRLEAPQAMLLVVPDGKVKLLNALPFACADLRRQSLAEAWALYRRAWDAPEVREFAGRAAEDASLLAHANETWDIPSLCASAAQAGFSL